MFDVNGSGGFILKALIWLILQYLATDLFRSRTSSLTAVLLGVALGTCIFDLVLRVLHQAIWILLEAKQVINFDKFFLIDDDRNVANVVACFFVDEFDFSEKRDYLSQKAKAYKPMRVRILRILGEYYRQQMSVKEFEKN